MALREQDFFQDELTSYHLECVDSCGECGWRSPLKAGNVGQRMLHTRFKELETPTRYISVISVYVPRYLLVLHKTSWLHSVENRGTFQQKLDQFLCEQSDNPDQSAEHNWSTMKKYIGSAAEAVVGHGRKQQANWLMDTVDTMATVVEHETEHCK